MLTSPAPFLIAEIADRHQRVADDFARWGTKRRRSWLARLRRPLRPTSGRSRSKVSLAA
jgi:hypothetical protein